MTIVLLPGAALSPEVLLHQSLESMDDVKGVIVLKINEAGAVNIAMSRITLHELTYAALMLQLHTNDVVSGKPPEGFDMLIPPGAA